MQVHPMKSALKPPGSKRLKLKYDKPLSNCAVKFNLRRYNEFEMLTKSLLPLPDKFSGLKDLETRYRQGLTSTLNPKS